MKFKNRETGIVYETIALARASFCKRTGSDCIKCPIARVNNGEDRPCGGFALAHQAEAARMMGYEVVEDECLCEKCD